MRRATLEKLMDREWAEIKQINATKGKDYAGDDDALSNFKRQADRLGLSPEQVWAVYFSKHVDAVMSYCKNGQVESEPIEGRLHDIIVYSFLMLGLVEEDKTKTLGPLYEVLNDSSEA